MANFIPIHKAKFKQILNSLVWNGATFEQKERDGRVHIKAFFTSFFDFYPAMSIFASGGSSEIADTAYNLERNNYTIRVINRFQDGKEEQENEIDQLVSLIMDALVNNYAKTNAEWENLTKIKVSTFGANDQNTFFFKDITFEVWNTQNRNLQFQ